MTLRRIYGRRQNVGPECANHVHLKDSACLQYVPHGAAQPQVAQEAFFQGFMCLEFLVLGVGFGTAFVDLRGHPNLLA